MGQDTRSAKAQRVTAMSKPIAITVIAFAALAVGAPLAAADSDKPWHVEHKLRGQTKNGETKHSSDISGIACMSAGFPRTCLVIDDEVQFAQVAIVKDQELLAGDTIDLVDPSAGDLSLDGEGVAFADGAFYIIGSHGHPRDPRHRLDPVADREKIEARITASSKLIRLTIDPATVTSEGKLIAPPKARAEADLRPMIRSEPALAPIKPFLGQRLEEESNGLTIEGIAAVGRRLYVGLRAPVLDGDRAAVISFNQAAPFEGGPAEVQLDRLALGANRGVRDLAVHGSGLLVLAGPAFEPKQGETGKYSIFAWDRADMLVLLRDLPPFEDNGEELKPEALLPLRTHADGTLDVLVLFDHAKEGAPRQFRLPM
jgi:hypothetical protein